VPLLLQLQLLLRAWLVMVSLLQQRALPLLIWIAVVLLHRDLRTRPKRIHDGQHLGGGVHGTHMHEWHAKCTCRAWHANSSVSCVHLSAHADPDALKGPVTPDSRCMHAASTDRQHLLLLLLLRHMPWLADTHLLLLLCCC
jgi:hypothetical protein